MDHSAINISPASLIHMYCRLELKGFASTGWVTLPASHTVRLVRVRFSVLDGTPKLIRSHREKCPPKTRVRSNLPSNDPVLLAASLSPFNVCATSTFLVTLQTFILSNFPSRVVSCDQ